MTKLESQFVTAVTGKLQASKMQHEQQWQTAYDQMMAELNDNSFTGQFKNDVSLAWNMYVGYLGGLLQGGLNLLVVAGNTVVGLGNLAIWTSPPYWIGKQFGLSLTIPSIPSARDVIVTESDWEYNTSWWLQQAGVALVTLQLPFGSGGTAGEVAGDGSALLKIAQGSGPESAPMKIVEIVEEGYNTEEVEDYLKQLTFAHSVEHALVRLANGDLAIVSGGRTGIDVVPGAITELLIHTHPYDIAGAGPSDWDRRILQMLGQEFSVLLERGERIIFGPFK